ncbi:MAG: dipeptidase [Chloroflexi bacterium]|nr:dipeptidase [Chloroflexota bacterium]
MVDWRDYLEKNQPRFLGELIEFLRIPSISALPEHAEDVSHAADWLARRLAEAGVENAQVLATGGHPVVHGDWLHAPNKPTVLIYGHFDVQPVDPLGEWERPPFEPEVQDGRIYARGASDNKGNLMVPVLAVEALLRAEGSLPVNVKFFFEGQEEIGSPQLPAFIEQHRDLLACDMVLNADVSQWGENQPALLVGLRGACSMQIDVRGPNSDLHSGVYGGAVRNPVQALVEILASMLSPEGRITVEGFYDDVQPLSEEERAQIAAVPLDEAKYKRDLGVDALHGEPGYTTLERTWARPTLDVNGIWGGFQGEGAKTVIPREAHCKFSCRLVPYQDPDKIVRLLTDHVRRHTPTGVRVDVQQLSVCARPYLIPADHWGNQVAGAVLEELYGVRPLQIRMGGSVPICGLFQDVLGVYTIGFGFALEDERIHAPNEFYRVSSFRRGQLAYGMMLKRLAEAR